MPCACRENKTRPFGPSAIADAQKAREASRPATSNNPPKQTEKEYVLRTPQGLKVFGSRLEAEAHKRRYGGGAIIARG